MEGTISEMIIEKSALLISVTELADLLIILLFASHFIMIKHKPVWFWTIFFASFAILYVIINTFSSSEILASILFATTLIIFVFLFSEASTIRKIRHIVFSLLLLFSVKFLYSISVIWLSLGLPAELSLQPTPIRIYISLTSRLILTALVILIRNRDTIKQFSVPQTVLLFLCIVQSCVFFFMLTIQIASRNLFDDYIAVCSIFLCLQTISYLCMFLSIKRRDDALRENAVTIQKLEDDQKQYLNTGEHIKELETWKHDMKKHLQALLSMSISAPDKERIQAYISEIQDGLDHTQAFVDTGNPLFDSIISANSSSSVGSGIAVRLEMIVPPLGFIDDIDLSAVLGNMWENAIEGCMRARENGAVNVSICFCTFINNNHFVMELSNTCIPHESDELQSRKTESGHGIGLNVIRKLTNKYHGIYEFRTEFDVFVSRVAIPVNSDHADGIYDFTVFNWSSVQ